ncbi:MAG TPA: GMC family oxidoreductase [Gemmatimonadales bacterium]|jgi:choline dehydrogenase-like flavoprotein
MRPVWDAVVIGSGFGGVMAATPLVEAGMSVLLLERGDWVRRGAENWAPSGAGLLTPHFSTESSYQTRSSGQERPTGLFFNVGGPSVFYGAASLRYREPDFTPGPDIVGDSGAAWPLRYPDLEPWYAAAERMLGVAGEAGADPSEPPRSSPFPIGPLAARTEFGERLARAARALGLQPFPLPLAINRDHRSGRPACIACATCDGFACALGAKNDLSISLLPRLLDRGLTLWSGAVVRRIVEVRGRAVGVECVDRISRRQYRVRAERVIVAAGAIVTPQLLLASGLARLNRAGDLIGRFLTRHLNTVVVGVFPSPPNPRQEFQKQIALHDYYLAAPRWDGGLGAIQQVGMPPAGVVAAQLPFPLGALARLALPHLGGLLTIVEDQPQYRNRIELRPERPAPYGLPPVVIDHRYSGRDLQRGRALAGRARAILARAGALLFYHHRIETFSHALGTVRMGHDPVQAPLDAAGRLRGVTQLWVTDGSALPTSAAVNPSLTIAANALRIGAGIAGTGAPAALSRKDLAHHAGQPG